MTSDGFRMQGEFRDGALRSGDVRDSDGKRVAEIVPPPTAEELAVRAADRVAWIQKRIREPEQWAMDASERAADVLNASDRARAARSAEGAVRQTGDSLDQYRDCPSAERGIQAARELIASFDGVDSKDPLTTAAALKPFGPRFQRVWAAPAAELAKCYGVELPPPIAPAPAPEPGPRVRVLSSSGIEAFTRPPPGWSCRRDAACDGPAGRAWMTVTNARDGIEALIKADWAKVSRGCAEIESRNPRQRTLACNEGDLESDAEGQKPYSYIAYLQIPGETKVVVFRVYTLNWNKASIDLMQVLQASIEIQVAP